MDNGTIPTISRRALLSRAANGVGAVAFSCLMNELSADDSAKRPVASQAKPKARSVIFLYMDGGPSQIDTFDPKPLLDKHHGKEPASVFKVEPTQFNNNGRILKSPWSFKQYGNSGLWISSLFPHLAKVADELCVVRSMTSKFSEHTAANYFLHTGLGLQGRPSVGAWFSYGLGSENHSLPFFVVLNGGLIPVGGIENFGNGFLPSQHQGSIFFANDPPLHNIKRRESEELQKRKRALLEKFDQRFAERVQHADQVESAIQNYETAFRMQTSVPELADLSKETKATQQAYGLEHPMHQTRVFARQCLLARRLVERGVRFIELTCPGNKYDRWDQHANLLEGHEANAQAVDQPIAALLNDLRQRGLLDQTLVVFAGEFGRTPFAQGSNGRDHNPFGFSIWLAGGGVKPGTVYGDTDDFGYKAIAGKCDIHDLHATMLHLFGVDHKKLTFRYGGRDMRLTDVHGNVLTDILKS